MNWPSKFLREVLEQSGQNRAGNQDLPVLSITMKYGLVDQADKFKKRIASADTSNYRIAYKSELVVGFPIDEGVLGFQNKYPAGIVSPAYDIWKLKSGVECHIPYLERYLRSPQARSLYASRMQGAVARRRSLTKADFLNLEVPFPSRDDQIRIAHLLGKVEFLIAQRRQHLQQLDDLFKSVFLEMFGDPVLNERGWDIAPCDKAVLDISSGTSYGGEDRAFRDANELGVLKISAVTKGVFDPTEFKVVNPAQITKGLRFVRRGDFLFSRANTAELVAACCVVSQDYSQLFLPDKLWVLTLDSELLNPHFFNYLLKNNRYRDVVRGLASGGHDSMLNISMKRFMTLDIPCPPLALQERFASIVGGIEAIETRYRQSLTDLESLSAALSQQAFNGQLDSSRVPMPSMKFEGETAVVEDVLQVQAEKGLPIDLPECDELQGIFESAEARGALITRWLEAYRSQLGSTPFSVARFMAAAQDRLQELYPDHELALGASDYECVKTWVFEALAAGTLTQVFDDAGNRVQLETAQA
jgi:type I restriction enzyme S subunit